MAFRSDISVQWHLSPRIVTVAAPSTEVTIQDLHDTLRVLEQRPENLIYPSIVSSAGKEALGGGVRVGITTTLINARLAFQARKVSQVESTVTTGDASGRVLIDTSGNFISNGIQPGAWVVNLTDGSVCSVVTVDSQSQLTTDTLGDGTTNQFAFGDSYRVQNVTQCNVDGGNLVAIDTIGSELDPILPTVGTQVVRTSSSSATLQELLDIQHSSFSGGVTLDPLSSYTGNVYPVGTPRQPVNNITDALNIASIRGFSTIYLEDDYTLSEAVFANRTTISGYNQTDVRLFIDPNPQVQNCTFSSLTITGTLDGGSVIRDCTVLDLKSVDGKIYDSILSGTVTLLGDTYIMNCWSGATSYPVPVIDFANTGASLALRNFNGGIEIKNKTLGGNVIIDINSGHLILDSTVTSGSITVRGIGKLTDNSSGAIVDDTHLVNPQNVGKTTWNTAVSGSTAANIISSISTNSDALSFAMVAGTTTVAAGSTSTAVRTGLTQSDGFFDGMLATIIGSAGACVRTISYYQNTNGTLNFEEALPFVPTASDTVYILSARNDPAGRLR